VTPAEAEPAEADILETEEEPLKKWRECKRGVRLLNI
jgi:hypothetical protein